MKKSHLQLAIILSAGLAYVAVSSQKIDRQWLAGDSHIHSQWSPDYDETTNPPTPLKGADGRYSTPTNAKKAREYGLAWMVTTDHGGPNHAKFNLTQAYAELQASRQLVPDVFQFYGMELNMPGMDHHTLIIPNSSEESSVLYEIEQQFDSQEAWPRDPSRNSEAQRQRALEHMKRLPRLPLLFANHPSRSAMGLGVYGLDEPREFRDSNDLAPDVYHGMEGAPGHQAGGLAPGGGPKVDDLGRPRGFRGAYGNPGAYTIGGFDQMTAIVGGLWDSMLGEGRRFWIVATSDSHVNYADAIRPGSDFWPGQYQKTYVQAVRSYDGILDALRSGRIFAVAGDLISALDIDARSGKQHAGMGETLTLEKGQDLTLTIRFRDPETQNGNGDNPRVARVDLIIGDIRGPAQDSNSDRNETARVARRFTSKDWKRSGDAYSLTATLPKTDRSFYIRLRGTSTSDLEPMMDSPGENPWPDLWFYSNPIFVEAGSRTTLLTP